MSIESTQEKLLEKILNSNEFSHSKIYQTYLTYLVTAAIEGKQLKEATIAIEVFDKDSSFNPAEDTIVRSHTYILRRKLESYYYNEGKEDKYRLKIPKGHYEIQFVSGSENPFSTKNLFGLFKKRFAVILIAILCCLILVIWFHSQSIERKLASYQVISQNDPIWQDYFQSDLPILIVIGDHFFYNDFSEKYKQTITIRNPKVNSIEDFRTLYPDLRVNSAPEPYFPYHSIWSLPPILSILYSMNKTPILRKSSDISPQILNEYNIIFLGSIKTLYALKYTLLKSHFRYEISPHKIIYSLPDSNSVRIFETSLHSEGPNEDLVLALKLPGPSNNPIFIIASYHSLGAPEIAYYLTNPGMRGKLLEKFQGKYNQIPKYFEVLFRVSGIDKTAYNTEILIFNEISVDNSKKLP